MFAHAHNLCESNVSTLSRYCCFAHIIIIHNAKLHDKVHMAKSLSDILNTEAGGRLKSNSDVKLFVSRAVQLIQCRESMIVSSQMMNSVGSELAEYYYSE